MTPNTCLIEGPIPVELIDELATGQDAASGGIALFLGRVRNDRVDGKAVMAIEYTAYEAMIEPVIHEIRNELYDEFTELTSLVILHSTGLVPSGGISLLVGIAAVHRKQALAALEKCIERIKARLPVWKKELFDDGSCRWIG